MKIVPMNESYASTILGWVYPSPYDFYNLGADGGSAQELLEDDYHAVLDEQDNLIGFLAFGESCTVDTGNIDDYPLTALDIGLGMAPELTGQGNGLAFVEGAIRFAITSYNPLNLRLTVATFNERARKVYDRAGFVLVKEVVQQNTGRDFLILEKSL